MKTIYLPFLLLLAVLACKDDDDPEPKPDAIVGVWRGDRSDIQVNYGLIPVYDETDEEFDVTLEFKEDGTAVFTQVSDGTETTGTYTYSEGELTTNLDLVSPGVSGSTTFDVIELTDQRLRLRLNDTREINVPDYGNVEVDIIATLEFDRM